MKVNIYAIFASICIFSGIAAITPSVAVGADTATHKEAQSIVQNAVDNIRLNLEKKLGNPVPSLSLLIQTPEEEIFAASVYEGVTPPTKDTYFRFASNTKTFTSTAILNMHQDGWIDYKAKITDNIPGSYVPYVPDLPEWNIPNKNIITIEQLLQHSAGVMDIDNDTSCVFNNKTYVEFIQDKDPDHQFRVDEFSEQLTKYKLAYKFPPGKGFKYSDTGYAILSDIISRVYSIKTGKPKTYQDYMNDYIVGVKAKVPLKSIHFPILASDKDMPTPFVKGSIRTKAGTEEFYSLNMSSHVGEGNGYGTLADLNKFIRTLMKGENVLTPETVHIMQTSTAPNVFYALGCKYEKNLGFGHDGATDGYFSLMMYDPVEDVSVTVLLPLWDFTNGNDSFYPCFFALTDAAYASRSALGYSGKPQPHTDCDTR